MSTGRTCVSIIGVLLFMVALLAAQQAPPPLAITTESLPRPLVRQHYEGQLKATGGVPPLRWSIAGGQLPDGLNLDPLSGSVSGEPEKIGEFNFTVMVTDSAGHTATREFKIKVAAPLLIEWSQFPHVDGGQIVGSVKVANGTEDEFDLTVIILAVNEYGKAFALGYQHFPLKPDTSDVEIPFGSTLPAGSYVVHGDAVAEVAAKNTIYRARQQTQCCQVVTTGP